jgi:hypothetical protein
MRPQAVAALALASCVAIAGCLGDATGSAGVSSPEPVDSPAPTTADSPAVRSARAELVRVLGTQNLVLQDPQNPFRPAEGPALAGAPRALFQVVLPDDPLGGYIVVYDLGDPQRAAAAGADQAAYLSSGPGRVQTPIGTRHHIRQLGPTLVTYSWNPDGATDERAPRIEAAILELGTAIEIPR